MPRDWALRHARHGPLRPFEEGWPGKRNRVRVLLGDLSIGENLDGHHKNIVCTNLVHSLAMLATQCFWMYFNIAI